MTKRKTPEKDMIVNSPKRRPYGAKLTLLIDEHTHFVIEGECSIVLSSQIIIRLSPYTDKCWNVYVEGFATAGEAEQAGLKVAFGFLWSAINGNYSLRLLYHTPLPCVVYDRTKSNGLRMTMNVKVSVGNSIQHIVNPINEIISSSFTVDQKLLVAMELFAAARQESTERSRFVGLVSSLEPLSNQTTYNGNEIDKLISSFQSELTASELDNDIKQSLKGTVENLKRESVSRAIRRLVKETLPNKIEALEIVEEAYSLRSDILHEGSTDADLNQKSQELEEIIREIIKVKITSIMNNNI